LDARTLAFYAFPEISDPETFKAEFRRAIDRAGREIGEVQGVIEEAAAAFRLNIELSLEVQSAMAPCA
jgi:heme oxygenase